MAQTRDGATKIAAKRRGISVDEYRALINAGQKWCTRGKHWQDRAAFTCDRSRSDGLDASCLTCRLSGKCTGPSLPERRARLQAGQRWCRGCVDWLSAGQVRGGTCRVHAAAEERLRYATDLTYRAERRQHAHARKRSVDPIPPDAQMSILEDFDYLCAYCPGRATTWDHIVPISQGGRTTPGNMVPACSPCNSSKHDKEVHEWARVTGRIVSEAFFARYELAWAGLNG